LKQNDFKHILSLVPAIYMNDFQDIQTAGKVSLSGSIKGVYNENRLPGFNINLLVDNARFQYPDLPSSVENIQMDLNIENTDGIDDHTLVNLKKFHLEMEDNPFDMKMKVSTPVSDPNIDGKIVGKIDLDKLKDLIPDENMKVAGLIDADIEMKGKMSSIESENYDEFRAVGKFDMRNFNSKGSFIPPVYQFERIKRYKRPK